MSLSESQKWGRLTVRLETSFGQAVDTHELEWVLKVGRLIVRLVKSLGQTVDTNELEWESRVAKINSKTRKIIRSDSRYKWVRVRVKSGED
jgi:hypothetical protein